mgnify:CR=1 FL=1
MVEFCYKIMDVNIEVIPSGVQVLAVETSLLEQLSSTYKLYVGDLCVAYSPEVKNLANGHFALFDYVARQTRIRGVEAINPHPMHQAVIAEEVPFTFTPLKIGQEKPENDFWYLISRYPLDDQRVIRAYERCLTFSNGFIKEYFREEIQIPNLLTPQEEGITTILNDGT